MRAPRVNVDQRADRSSDEERHESGCESFVAIDPSLDKLERRRRRRRRAGRRRLQEGASIEAIAKAFGNEVEVSFYVGGDFVELVASLRRAWMSVCDALSFR